VLAIHVISKAADTGILLTPPQLFQFPTVAQLAAAVRPDQIISQDDAAGAWPLSPFQQWFFDQQLPQPGARSQALLLEVPPIFDVPLLEQAAQHVLAHHDALRLRFTGGADGWRQHPATRGEHPIVVHVDHAGLPMADRAAALDAHMAAAQAAFDLAAGPLVHIALIDYGIEHTARLLVLAHRLIVDLASWPVLLGDLWTAYDQLSRGDDVELAPSGATFKQWSEQMAAQARSEALGEELPYWLAELGPAALTLPADADDDSARPSDAPIGVVAIDLSAEETHELLEVAPRAYRMQVEDILLTALVDAFARWLGDGALLVDVENSRREAVFDGMDLSRTVGCCTTVFPVRLDLSAPDQPEQALKAIKELLLAIPRQRTGYGLLRYLSEDAAIVEQLAALPGAEVSFSYLDQSDRMLPKGAPFQIAPEWAGPVDSPRGAGPYQLEIEARAVAGRLQVEWVYSQRRYRHATIARLANDFMAALQELVAHCRSREQVSLSTSDFPEAGLSQDELDKFLTSIRRPS
jgi:non-ribosomal peptide synthase protein (TIGR01720 family)